MRLAMRVAAWGGMLLVGGCLLPAQTPHFRYESSARELADLVDDEITEASGLVASRANDACFYVHNDSGDRSRVFLIGRDGRTRTTIQMRGAPAVDYEDIAIAPGADVGRFDVCVADIGDNNAKRPHVTIYRFRDEVRSGQEATVDVEPTEFRFRYADGPRDAEAFVVDPDSGDGYVFTKRRDGRTFVYRLAAPWSREDVAVAERVMTITLPLALLPARIVTGADWSADGRRLIVRCYVHGWEWHAPGDEPLDPAQLAERAPQRVYLAGEAQGEAVAYATDGGAILTVSEGLHPPLHELRLLSSATAPAP